MKPRVKRVLIAGTAVLSASLILGVAYLFADREKSRTEAGRVVCVALNRNGAASNRNTRYIEGLIVAGAEQSKVFDPIYRKYGLPPYETRLEQAKRSAAKLKKLELPVLDCSHFLEELTNKP